MSGISRYQDAAGPVTIGHPVMHPESGTPHDFLDSGRSRNRSAFVQQMLHVGDVGMFGCFVHRGHYPVTATGQGRDDESLRREEQHHLVLAQRPRHPDVGEHEGVLIGITGESDTGALAHSAVHAIGADHVPGAHPARFLPVGTHGDRDALGVLQQVGHGVRPVHVAAHLAEALQQ